MTVAVKALSSDVAVVAGYGVLFGGEDLTGERFTHETDFVFDLVPVKPVYYDHASQDAVKHSIGRVVHLDVDARGVWVEAQLDRRAAYVEDVLELVRQGALGYSSGSVVHLVRREGPVIKAWPLVEFSLTPTPAEPRTAVVQVKSGAAVLDNGSGCGVSYDVLKGVSGMTTYEEMAVTEGTVGMLDDGYEAAVKAIQQRVDDLERLVSGAPARVSGYAVGGDTDSRVRDERAVKAWNVYVRTGDRSALKAALQEGTPSEGGYIVPQVHSAELVAALKDASVLRQAGARVIRVGRASSFKVPTMTQSGAAVLTSEEGSFSEKEPTFGEVTFTPWKYTKLVKVSDELLEDASVDVMSHVLMPDFAQAFAAAENSDFTTGSGASRPEGVVTGATVSDIATGVAPTADNIIDLYHTLPHMYRQNAVWLMSDTLVKSVRKLKESGSDGQYLWQPGLQAGQPSLLMGRPVYTLNTMSSTIGADEKVIVFGDLSYFWIVDFGQESMVRLNELYAETGQVGFRMYRRFDSHVVLSEAIRVLQL